MKRTYFLSPTRDHPPNGPIALGSLIKSPRQPEFPLNNISSPAVQSLIASARTTHELDAVRSVNKSLAITPGIWTSFLNTCLAGLGGFGSPTLGLDFNLTKKDDMLYTTPKLETRTINPSLEDVRSIFSEERVQEAVKKSRFSANLYMVTGVQIAHGAEYIISKVRERGGNLHISADLGMLGAVTAGAPVPLTVGAGVEASWERRERAEGKVSGDFVFAYSLREVVYRRKRVVEQRASRVEGDLMGLDGDEDTSSTSNVKGKDDGTFEPELSGLWDKGPELAEFWDMDAEVNTDLDGEECLAVYVGDEEED